MQNDADFVAKFFRSLLAKKEFQTCIGVVIEPPPNLHISIMKGKYILYPRMLYMNDRLFDDYTRTYKLTGEITEYNFKNTTSSEPVALVQTVFHQAETGIVTRIASQIGSCFGRILCSKFQVVRNPLGHFIQRRTHGIR